MKCNYLFPCVVKSGVNEDAVNVSNYSSMYAKTGHDSYPVSYK